MDDIDLRCPRCERSYRLVDLGRDESYFVCEVCDVELTPVSLRALESTQHVEPTESTDAVPPARAPYHLNRVLGIAVGVGNLVLAVLLVLICVFPILLVDWVLVIAWYHPTHPLRSWIVLALWFWFLASAAVFAVVGVRSIVTGKWSLAPQIVPFLVAAALVLLAYLD